MYWEHTSPDTISRAEVSEVDDPFFPNGDLSLPSLFPSAGAREVEDDDGIEEVHAEGHIGREGEDDDDVEEGASHQDLAAHIAELKEHFKDVDRNRDGHLSPHELRLAGVRENGLSEDEAEEVVALLGGGEGGITWERYVETLAERGRGFEAATRPFGGGTGGHSPQRAKSGEARGGARGDARGAWRPTKGGRGAAGNVGGAGGGAARGREDGGGGGGRDGSRDGGMEGGRDGGEEDAPLYTAEDWERMDREEGAEEGGEDAASRLAEDLLDHDFDPDDPGKTL
jgi:hypothetical protein